MSQVPNLASSRINQAMRTDTTVGQARAEFTDAEAVSRAARMRLRDARRSRDPAAIAAATLALNEVERQRGAAQNTFADVGRLTRREAVGDRSDFDVAQARLRLARQLPGAIADGASDLRAQTLAAPPLSNNPTIRDVQERRRGQALNLADEQTQRAAAMKGIEEFDVSVFGPRRGTGTLDSTEDQRRLQSMRQVQRDAAGEIVPTTLGSRAAIGQQEQVAEAETQRRLAALRRQEEVALGERAVAEAGGQPADTRLRVGLSANDGPEVVQSQVKGIAASVANAAARVASTDLAPADATVAFNSAMQQFEAIRQTQDPDLRKMAAAEVLSAIGDSTKGGITAVIRDLEKRASPEPRLGQMVSDVVDFGLTAGPEMVLTGDINGPRDRFFAERFGARSQTAGVARQMLDMIRALEQISRDAGEN